MPALAARILPAALLERDDLRPAALLHHLGRDRGAFHRRGPEGDDVATNHQNLTKLDGLTRLARDLLNLQQVLGGDAILLATGLDDCEHLCVLVFESRRSEKSG